MNRQTTSHLLLIRPVNFTFNQDTAESNVFQKPAGDAPDLQRKALAEFEGLVNVLRENDLDVNVIDDTPQPQTPDSIFPNNWIAFIDDTIYTFPMQAANRRLERRNDIVEDLQAKYAITNHCDLSDFELRGRYLEGTGSIVPDRVNRIAYACRSPRTDAEPLAEFCRRSGYKAVVFDATDRNGTAIYHTNVMMAVGDKFAAVCLDAVKNNDERTQLLASFAETGKEVVELAADQLYAFAGNMLQVENGHGEKLLILSQRAYRSLTPEQVKSLQQYSRLIPVPIQTIEDIGGGSVRCMIAEIFSAV